MDANQQLQEIMKYTAGDTGKKVLFVCPESHGDIVLATSLLESLSENYPDHNIYFACMPQYFEILEGHPLIYKTIPYYGVMDACVNMEGNANWPGLFDLCFMVTILSQRCWNFVHNGKSRIAFDLRG